MLTRIGTRQIRPEVITLSTALQGPLEGEALPEEAGHPEIPREVAASQEETARHVGEVHREGALPDLQMVVLK